MMSSTNKLNVPQSIPYKGQVDNIHLDGQPDQTEPLDVGLANKGLYFYNTQK